jgi:hypothetical protein
VFLIRQVFVKVAPGVNNVSSGIVTSSINFAESQGRLVGVVVGACVGISVSVGETAVGGTSNVAGFGSNTVGSAGTGVCSLILA